MEEVDFAGATLSKSLFIESELHQCDFSGAQMQYGNFMKGTVAECHFVNADLAQAIFKQARLQENDFSNSNMIYADLSYAEANKCKFNQCSVLRTKVHALLQGTGSDKCDWKGVAKSGLMQTDKKQQDVDELLDSYGQSA